MKVLWFTNTPSLGADYLNVKGIGGGWIESLEEEINKTPNLELGVVFKWNKPGVNQFVVGNTIYYPIKNCDKPNRKAKTILNRWTHKIENEKYIQQYLEVILQFNPDIIHIFGSENDFGLIVSKTSIPCVIHIQGNLNVYSHKWFSGISQLDLIRFTEKTPFLKGFGLIHNYFTYKKEAKRELEIFKSCNYFMGRTDWDKRIMLALSTGSSYFHCDEMLRKQFYLHQWNPNKSQDYSIFTTIRNNTYKGLETILECKKILDYNLKEFKITWKIAGISKFDEIAKLIERKYKDKFLNLNIHLLGPLQEKELITEMISSDLFIHPSHIDNSPNSVCEAMLLGMPIISTYAGGIPSIIADKEEGLLVQDGDPFALTGAIIELKKDRNYAATLGANAKNKAVARHNPEKIVNDLLNIYASITNERKQSSQK